MGNFQNDLKESISQASMEKILLQFSKNLNEFHSPEEILTKLLENLKSKYLFDLSFLSDMSDPPIIIPRSSSSLISSKDLNSLLNEVLEQRWKSETPFIYLTYKEGESVDEKHLSKYGVQSLFITKISTILFPEYFLGFMNFNCVSNLLNEDIVFLCALANIVNQSISYHELKKLFETSYDKLQINIERIQRENEQRRELLKKVREQTKELQRRHIEMEEFVYTISHDLKAPIISIQGFVTALHEDFSNILPNEAQFYLERIRKNTAQIEGMIREILDYSRIGRITQEKENLDLKTIIEDAFDQLSSQINQSNIKTIFPSDSIVIKGEKNRMLQLFSNLIGNSVKYIGDQPDPFIEVGILKVESKFTTIFVKDNGMGIPEEFQNKVFNIFARATNINNQEIDGTGIGLAHCKKIVETHGGEIWLESEEGKGTTIFFQLPLVLQEN
ncbi:MAG: ATP-binding protein [Promethearchaeota archaeon]